MAKPSIFLSYAREDVQAARRLYNGLKEAGADVWFDEASLKGGQDWRTAIRNGMEQARYFVALMSSNSVQKRGFVQKEMRAALEILDEFPPSQVYLIPVRLDETEPQFERLKGLHWIDLFPSWAQGVQRLLLTIDLSAGSNVPNTAEQAGVHPKDKTFHVSAEWTKVGLEIRGGQLRIPPEESKPLIEHWLQWLPRFIEQERPKSESETEALEKAFILASLRATYEVYGGVPDEDEMTKGLSIRSRKLNLFYGFSKDAYLKAKRRGIDPGGYLLGTPSTEESDPAKDPKTLYRILLHTYISRVCDVNLDRVEQIEKLMVSAPPWEPLVETVYEIDAAKVLSIFREARALDQFKSDEELVDAITAGIIELNRGLEAYPFEQGGT